MDNKLGYYLNCTRERGGERERLSTGEQKACVSPTLSAFRNGPMDPGIHSVLLLRCSMYLGQSSIILLDPTYFTITEYS